MTKPRYLPAALLGAILGGLWAYTFGEPAIYPLVALAGAVGVAIALSLTH